MENGDVGKTLGSRMAQHILQGLTETRAMLLLRADALRLTGYRALGVLGCSRTYLPNTLSALASIFFLSAALSLP
jgi:hypothetical protein